MKPSGWLDLKRRWLRYWLIWICWIPVAALFGAGKPEPRLADDFGAVISSKVAHWLHLPDIGDWAWVVLVVWAIIMFIALQNIFRFICPHCQEPFFAQKTSRVPYHLARKQCIHCDSPKWS